MFFCLAFKNIGICSVLCISGPKSIDIYSIFCVFAWLPQKTLKHKCCNLQHFVTFEKRKIVRKMCQNGTFFRFQVPSKRGGAGFCSWRRLWATRIPSKKLSPTLLKDFWCFSAPGVGGSAAWGAPHHRALVALGRSWRICQRTRGEPAEPNFKGWRPSSAPPYFSILHFIAVWAWKLLDGDLLQKYIPYVFWKKFME